MSYDSQVILCVLCLSRKICSDKFVHAGGNFTPIIKVKGKLDEKNYFDWSINCFNARDEYLPNSTKNGENLDRCAKR